MADKASCNKFSCFRTSCVHKTSQINLKKYHKKWVVDKFDTNKIQDKDNITE